MDRCHRNTFVLACVAGCQKRTDIHQAWSHPPGTYASAERQLKHRTSELYKNSCGSVWTWRTFLERSQESVQWLTVPGKGSIKYMLPVKEGTQKESFRGRSLSLGSGTLQLKSIIGRIPLRCVLHGPSMFRCLGGTGNKIWKREVSERRGPEARTWRMLSRMWCLPDVRVSPEVRVTLGHSRETLSARVRMIFSLKGKGMPCPGFYLRQSFH